MASTTAAKGMLYVSSSPGPNLPLEEFTKWYDEDHAPLRRSVPGFLNASRYLAIDGKKPEWLAIYELEDVAVMDSKAYLDQWNAQTEYDKDVFARCDTVDRRIYTLTYDKRHPDYSQHGQKILHTVALAPGLQLAETEFHAWYFEEHIPLLSSVPGWLRSSRWELAPDALRPGGVTTADGKPVSKYLAIHEWVGEEVYTTPQYKTATITLWRTKVMDGLDREVEDRRKFKVYKLWK